MTQFLLRAFVLILVGTLGCGGGEDQATGDAEKVAHPTVQLAVGGMHCQGCADGIQAALGRTDGVSECRVSFADSSAVVVYDSTRASLSDLIAVVERLGYRAQSVE